MIGMTERCTSDLPVPVEPTIAIMGCLGGILLICLNLCKVRNMKSSHGIFAGAMSRNYLENAMTCDRKETNAEASPQFTSRSGRSG